MAITDDLPHLEKSKFLFETAALKGSVEGQWRLGALLNGIKQNGSIYLRKAARRQSKEARLFLSEIEKLAEEKFPLAMFLFGSSLLLTQREKGISLMKEAYLVRDSFIEIYSHLFSRFGWDGFPKNTFPNVRTNAEPFECSFFLNIYDTEFETLKSSHLEWKETERKGDPRKENFEEGCDESEKEADYLQDQLLNEIDDSQRKRKGFW